MYLMTSSRPDLAFTLSRLSKFFAAPRASHERFALYLLRYLKGTANHGITYGSTSRRPYYGFTDADWAEDVDNRKSTGGYIFLLTGGAVSWRSKQQNSVARSSTEAEYIAASDAAAEIVWAHRLLKELDTHDGNLTKLFIDNESAMKLAKNAVYHARTKHIDVDHHFIRYHIGVEVSAHYVPSADNVADMFTKSLPVPAHRQHMQSMGLAQIPSTGV